MDEQINTGGRGSLGTATNNPVSDSGTMARTTHRPNATQTGGSDLVPGSYASKLDDRDRDFIDEMHRIKMLDHSKVSLQRLWFLRSEYAAMRDKATDATSKAWCQKLVDALDEEIEIAKSALASAIKDLRDALTDPASKESDRSKKVSALIQALRNEPESTEGGKKNPRIEEAMTLIGDAVVRGSDERNQVLEDLVEKEKSSSGSVSDERFSAAVAAAMGAERQRELLGLNKDDEPTKAMSLAVDTLVLVADRHVARLQALVNKETRSPGSVSARQFTKMVTAVLGDAREKELLGLSDRDSMKPVRGVLKVFLNRRKKQIDRMFKAQQGGAAISNDQINEAIADFEAAKEKARVWGVHIVDAPDIPDQDFDAVIKPKK
jgi:hypothetical protein